MSTTLELFWNLSSQSKKDRIDASIKLISALESFQSQFTPAPPQGDDEDENNNNNSGSEEDEDALPDPLNALNAQDVAYSIRRLVRGLASPRESSRLGFSVALTELLSRLDTVTCSQVITLINDASKPQGSVTGQEERDLLFARLFGLTAVIRSGLLVRPGSLSISQSSSAVVSSLSSFQDVVTQLDRLGESKSWLKESAWWSILLAVDALHASKVDWKDEAEEWIIKIVFEDDKSWSPEKLALALKLRLMHPKKDWKALFAPSFKNSDLLAPANLLPLGKLLKDFALANETEQNDAKHTAPGSWKPQLHFVWDIILDHLLSKPDSTTGSFQEFFRVVVDETLFSSTSSSERKYWGFQVFRNALPKVTADDMPMLFTKNFMRCWINHLSHDDRYLHKIAKQVATEIKGIVDKNPQLGFALLLQLTGVHGSNQFDKLTKTKTVEGILGSMSADGVQAYVEHLLDQVNSLEDAQTATSRRSWTVEHLSMLVRHTSIPKNDTWVQTLLNWLILHGLFIIKEKSGKSPIYALRKLPNPPISDEVHQNCRLRLKAFLADLLGQTTVIKQGDKMIKSLGVASDGELWLSKALDTIASLEADTKHVTPILETDEEIIALRSKALEMCGRLRKVTGELVDEAKGAELLLRGGLIESYCAGEEDEVDIESLESNLEAATSMFGTAKKKKTKSKKGEDEDEEDQAAPIDIFVDSIIGYLEKSTAFMRTIGNQAFALLSGSVKESTVDLILQQLERRDPSQLLEDEDEEGEMDVDKDEEGGGEDEDEEDSSSDEADDDEGDDNEDEEEDPELRQKIEEAIKAHGIEAANSDSESEEEYMDDEQMLAIDDQLAEIFKARANLKKGGKDVDAQREATHFKNRVLDLVDTFIKRQPNSSLILHFILPLIEVMSNSGQDERQLEDKTRGLLRSRIGKLKEAPANIDIELATTVLKEVHLKARKSKHAAMDVLSSCAVYVSRLLVQTKSEQAVPDEYKASLTDFVLRKNSCLKSAFFVDLFRALPVVAWGLRDLLCDLSQQAMNAYRRSQCFYLLQVLLSLVPSLNVEAPVFTEFASKLRKASVQAITDACNGTLALDASQIKDILKLALSAIRQTKRLVQDSDTLSSTWLPQEWNNLRTQLGQSDKLKSSASLQTMCNQIIQLCSANDKNAKEKKNEKKTAPAKRKADTTEDVGAKKKAKKVKKPKKREVEAEMETED